MNKTLSLHVGTHETGTTSFQRDMLDHREEYEARGLTFIATTRLGRPYGNLGEPANEILRRRLATRARRFWRRFGPVDPVPYDEALATEGSSIPALLSAMDESPVADVTDATYERNQRAAPKGVQ